MFDCTYCYCINGIEGRFGPLLPSCRLCRREPVKHVSICHTRRVLEPSVAGCPLRRLPLKGCCCCWCLLLLLLLLLLCSCVSISRLLCSPVPSYLDKVRRSKASRTPTAAVTDAAALGYPNPAVAHVLVAGWIA